MIALQTAAEWPDLSAGAEQQRSPITSSNEPASNPHYQCSLESRTELARAGPFPAVESTAFPGGGAPGSREPGYTRALALSLWPSGGRGRPTLVLEPALTRSCCPAGSLPVLLWPADLPGSGCCGYTIQGRSEEGAGRSPGTCQGRRRWQRLAHARRLPEAWNAEGRASPFARARLR